MLTCNYPGPFGPGFLYLARMRYLWYFFYLAWHWDIGMAWFVIQREIAGERKYGIRTIGTHYLGDAISADAKAQATQYEPVNYYSAETLMDHVTGPEKQTRFLDVGCGKGRMLAVAEAYGFKRITGVEFSPELCAAVKPGNYTVACVDARKMDIPDDTGVIFLFNPFNEAAMEEFVERVKESLVRKPRPVKVLYANPQHQNIWENAGWRETAAFEKMRFLKGRCWKGNDNYRLP